MDRFGSSKLRMVWAGVCLLLAGLVLTSVQGFGEGGTTLMVFGAGIPLGFEDPKPYVIQNLGRIVYSVVPAVILRGGFIPLGEWLAAGGRGERFKGLVAGTAFAFVHGLFLAQLALLPVLAASFRLLGNPCAPSIMLADANAVSEVGRIMAWGGEFLGDLDVPKGVVKAMVVAGKSFPSGQLPSDPLSLAALPFSLGVPLALAAILLLLPAKAAKRSRA